MIHDLVKFILTIASPFSMREFRKEEESYNATMQHLRLLCRHASFAGAYTAYRNYYKKDGDLLPTDLLRKHYLESRIEWLARNPR